MKLTSAILANGASVNDNQLFVLGGGINKIVRSEYPAALRLQLAVCVQFTATDVRKAQHRIAVTVDRRNAQSLGKLSGFVNVTFDRKNKPPRGLTEVGSFVVDLSRRRLPGPGLYVVRVELDGVVGAELMVDAQVQPEAESVNLA